LKRIQVADVDAMVSVFAAQLFFEPVAIPAGRCFVTEKGGAHIVVDTDDVHSFLRKPAHSL
jgi:hypothetical protein